MVYVLQDFDNQGVGEIPDFWFRGGLLSDITNLKSVSSPNSMRIWGQVNRQQGRNFLGSTPVETFRFNAWIPSVFGTTNWDLIIASVEFVGPDIPLNSPDAICGVRFKRAGNRIFYGTSGIWHDSGSLYTPDTWINVRIELNNGFLSVYIDGNSIVINEGIDIVSPTSFMFECPANFQSDAVYVDDFQIGEAPAPTSLLIIKNITVKNTVVKS